MAKDLLMRKCSHCGHNGHNSRTCNGKTCIKLFGIKIDKIDDDSNDKIESIRRTQSTPSLTSFAAESSVVAASGYHSDADEIKKGKIWTEEEHRSFLMGLEKLGKGDWRGISKNFVPSRTSTQVASHAQKYFIRMATLEKKKRRSSVFDISINENGDFTSPEEPSYQESNFESGSMLASSSQAMIPFENLLHKKSVETTTHVVSSSERPPLSPCMRHSGGFNPAMPMPMQMPYMMGQASSTSPGFSYVPLMDFPIAPSNSIYLPSAYNNANFAVPAMAVPHSGSGAVPCQAEPPSAMAISINKKVALELTLGSMNLGSTSL